MNTLIMSGVVWLSYADIGCGHDLYNPKDGCCYECGWISHTCFVTDSKDKIVQDQVTYANKSL